jgi:hypothetical protein
MRGLMMILAVYESKVIHFAEGDVVVSRTPIGYIAQLEGDEEGPQGEGDTVMAAIADLNEVLEERE